MIDVREVVKTFDGFRALDGLSFHVPKGAVYGLVGPNGCLLYTSRTGGG